MRQVNYESLSLEDKSLLEAAQEVMRNAYNLYSHFYVGAAILARDGTIITGVNVENAAYGSTICAERGAIMRAYAQGSRLFDRIAIIARGESFDTKEVSAPCGSCRQMLYEASVISKVDLEVIMSTTQHDKIVVATISELLPLAFGPEDLGVDVSRYRR